MQLQNGYFKRTIIVYRPWLTRPVLAVAVAVVVLVLGACSPPEPLKVGMIAGLTGRVTDMGVAGRDGVLLAVEEANARGGIDGRKITLIVRDDKQDKEQCLLAISQLIAQGVAGVVGPMTSAMAVIVVPEINAHAIPTISPTVSTGLLEGADDYFFRVIPVSTEAAQIAADYAYKQQYKSLLVIRDQGNSAYTDPWYQVLKKRFESYEGTRVETLSYVSRHGYDFLELAEDIIGNRADCLVILANALDTALISQQLAKFKNDTPIIASEWSLTEDLVEFGGRTVEGIRLFHSFNPNSDKDTYRAFALNFQKRFGYSADFASAYGYTAMTILLDALEKGTTSEEVKDAILQGSPYAGLQQSIRFDGYGDVKRKYTLVEIRNGKSHSVVEYVHE